MGKKATFIDFVREIKNSPGRFLSIFFIVALGVAFFSGIRATEPDMRVTADTYYDRTNLADVKAYSTYGITETEVEALAKEKDIEKATGSYSSDFLCEKNEKQIVLRVSSYLPEINQVSLEKGNLPEKIGECVVDSDLGYKVGDEIHLSLEGDKEVKDTLKQDRLKVVGIVNSPAYIGFERGNTNIGTGVVSGFCLVSEETFSLEVYTEVYLSVSGAKEFLAYTDEYDQRIEEVIDDLSPVADKLASTRQEELVEEANEEIEKARKEADEEIDKAKKELADGENQLNNAEAEIVSGEAQIEAAWAQLYAQEQELNQGWSAYYAGMNALAEGKAKYEAGESGYSQLSDQIQQLQASYDELTGGITQIEGQIAILEEKASNGSITADEAAQLAGLKAQLGVMKENQGQLGATLSQLNAQAQSIRQQLDASKAEIASNEAVLQASYQKLASGTSQLEAGKNELSARGTQLASGRAELDVRKNQLDSGMKELTEQSKEADKELSEAEAKVNDIKKPKWYIEDRSTFPDYTGYGDNALRIGKIGEVFPVIFFLVAALVSLTTMSRLVEEQRMAIGTMKALGYNKPSIAMKYIGYALLATVTGSIFGVLFGEKIFPYIIIYSYGMMYRHLPDIIVPYNLPLGLFATALAVFSTLLATIFSCYKELRQRPAVLMRPPAPKKGTRVFLERIGFIWKHLSFIWKSTIRNLMRYKKRFFMTVFGIAACMGLLITAFGIRDSIYDITYVQYTDLQQYEGQAIFTEDVTESEEADILDYALDDSNITAALPVYMKNVTLTKGKTKWDAYIFSPDTLKDLEDYIHFRDRKSHEEYRLDDKGAIISEKTAKELEVEVGDTIKIKEVETPVKIANICENYVGHYLYLSPGYYEEIFGQAPDYNSMLFNTKSADYDRIEESGERLLTQDGVLSIQYSKDLMRQMDDMIKTLNLVIIVLIIAAALLAFVVLYNLNTINISERRRELATIKVLGFYDMEVAKYVYRENIVLTVIGAICGIGFGYFLHQYIIQTVEVEYVMFGRVINFPSYIYSILFTVFFSLIVNVVMFYKLRNIDMVESLKSVE
ncbi:FtsX-like permease family protein [Ohessyouella blattaphilus]|uniref:ABC transporter permease n=1 Tax=Ohessyouella blattaphilus TaxID=2949333 RepID=A0ABT1EDP9_9FIRM|nr:FtsX-like permease family protein [Ohessyouella blattaphilus]MCP1108825.1 ABC transporter permease [Ohessyouella blattaphilus]MCR8562219.1 ABC transporter permease [Ohessyouella blattaphilus]